MRVKQVAVPMDFGVKNLAISKHINVALLAANGRSVKANSQILAYNSRVFENKFNEDELCESIDLTEFTRHVVDTFVKALYSGKLDFGSLPFMREIWQLADNFNVKWLLKQLDSHLIYLIEERMSNKPTFVNMKYIFEEANFFKTNKRRHEYMAMATHKLNSLYNTKTVKNKFFKRYICISNNDTVILNSNQINLLVDFAGENVDLLLNFVLKKVKRNNYTSLDMGSRHLLGSIDLAKCLKLDMDSYLSVFVNKDKYRNLSPDQVDELRRLEENSTSKVFRDRPDLRDVFINKKRQLTPLPVGYHFNTFPATTRDHNERIFSISNSRLVRKRPASGINIRVNVQRPRLDLHYYSDSSDDPDNNASLQLLEDTDRIPNIVFSVPDRLNTFQTANRTSFRNFRSHFSYTLHDVLRFFMTSDFSFRNMYMFVEYIFIIKAVGFSESSVSHVEMVQVVNNILNIKERHGWEKISLEFVKDILTKLMAGPMKNLLTLISENDDLISTTNAVEIISWRGVRSTLRTRKYNEYDTIRMGELIEGKIKKYKFFWKHPDTGECSEPGQCGFVLCVVPISKTFEIRLSTRPEDYSEDIHCHPELLNADDMHLVLRRDFSTKGKSVIDSARSHTCHVTWQRRPIFHKNHVVWCSESIPDNAYIAFIVYYSFGSN